MSWLKKEEIVEMVARVQKADSSGTCLLEADMLKSQGRGIVDIVLEEMFRLKEAGVFANRDSFLLYCLVISIEPYVESRHERQLGEILLWDEVALTTDGSARLHLLEMLRKVGRSVEMIDCLEQLSIKVRGVIYPRDPYFASPEYLGKYYQEEIQTTINAIWARVQQ